MAYTAEDFDKQWKLMATLLGQSNMDVDDGPALCLAALRIAVNVYRVGLIESVLADKSNWPRMSDAIRKALADGQASSPKRDLQPSKGREHGEERDDD